MKIVRDEIWLCIDCTMARVNKDFSELNNDPETADKRRSEIVAGLEKLGPNLILAFDTTGTGDAHLMLSSSCGCDCCQSSQGGTMHRFAVPRTWRAAMKDHKCTSQ